MNKLCPKCGIVKSYAEYNKSTKAKDGLQSSCKDCRSAAQRLARSTEAGRAKDIRYRNSRLGKETARTICKSSDKIDLSTLKYTIL